jgi:hypothetical protein
MLAPITFFPDGDRHDSECWCQSPSAEPTAVGEP